MEPGAPASKEPLQRLPIGMNRKHAQFSTDEPPVVDRSIRNVGGYETLAAVMAVAGVRLSEDVEGLKAVERFIDRYAESIRGLDREIGLFYGHVLTHTIVGSHWVVIDEHHPEVRVGEGISVDVFAVAQRRLEFGFPSLVENLAHAEQLVAGGDSQPSI
ncbi:DUF6278 family protein [Cryobacterium sp. GrIS_2_6]|uniref:DUF6278 family protein n=1 Tax=Cryobacterium sp. GrIS_2_6 TaxID=3162785 RepID=UPI002E0098FF|nr:hypothetical protein [Cryobacterium psychrotolerans]